MSKFTFNRQWRGRSFLTKEPQMFHLRSHNEFGNLPNFCHQTLAHLTSLFGPIDFGTLPVLLNHTIVVIFGNTRKILIFLKRSIIPTGLNLR